MNNPLRILTTLDQHLSGPEELTLFGRAALVLGYPGSPPEFSSTRDVDAILPLQWLESTGQHDDFWEAQQRTNEALAGEGLYVTRLFRESDLILTPAWFTRRVRIPLELRWLTLYRPHTLDLILTKMARADENDLADLRFLLRQERFTAAELQAAFARARVPEVPEIRRLFEQAQPRVLALLEARP